MTLVAVIVGAILSYVGQWLTSKLQHQRASSHLGLKKMEELTEIFAEIRQTYSEVHTSYSFMAVPDMAFHKLRENTAELSTGCKQNGSNRRSPETPGSQAQQVIEFLGRRI